MINIEGLTVSNDGILEIGGCRATDLVEKYGTPLYVMNEKLIRERCRLYIEGMKNFYGRNFNVIYASKAFMCKEICRIMKDEGMNIDVVSEGEIYTALEAEFPPERIYFHGNNKTRKEIFMAVKNKIGTIVLDNENEFDMVSEVCMELDSKINVMVRVKPEVEADTHKFIKTGQIDSKFGISLKNNEAENLILRIKKSNFLKFKGLHCHIGSQIFETDPFVLSAGVMCDFAYYLHKKFNIDTQEINLGGGFGIGYMMSDEKFDYKKCLERVHECIYKKFNEFGIDIPTISIEPGRSIVGEAGVTLYSVGNIKEIKGVRTYVSVDGGMTDNPRYILYEAAYEIFNAGKMNEKKDKLVTIAGKCCESGDIIQKDVKICDTKPGDILAVLCTGAYNYSMSSNYNRVPKPAVVMVNDGQSRLIVRRQTPEDIASLDI